MLKLKVCKVKQFYSLGVSQLIFENFFDKMLTSSKITSRLDSLILYLLVKQVVSFIDSSAMINCTINIHHIRKTMLLHPVKVIIICRLRKRRLQNFSSHNDSDLSRTSRLNMCISQEVLGTRQKIINELQCSTGRSHWFCLKCNLHLLQDGIILHFLHILRPGNYHDGSVRHKE